MTTKSKGTTKSRETAKPGPTTTLPAGPLRHRLGLRIRWKGIQMWIAFTILMAVWFVLKFILHKGGYVHILVIGAISVLVVQLIAERKTQHHRTSNE
jgi:hypothetical protein